MELNWIVCIFGHSEILVFSFVENWIIFVVIYDYCGDIFWRETLILYGWNTFAHVLFVLVLHKIGNTITPRALHKAAIQSHHVCTALYGCVMERACAHGVIVILVCGVHLRTRCYCVVRLRNMFVHVVWLCSTSWIELKWWVMKFSHGNVAHD